MLKVSVKVSVMATTMIRVRVGVIRVGIRVSGRAWHRTTVRVKAMGQDQG